MKKIIQLIVILLLSIAPLFGFIIIAFFSFVSSEHLFVKILSVIILLIGFYISFLVFKIAKTKSIVNFMAIPFSSPDLDNLDYTK
jgi:hypothetical protein